MNRRTGLAWSPGAAGPLLKERGSDWRLGALCAQVGGDLWFPEDNDPAIEARAICARCPVIAPCLEDALAHDDQHGIQAGLTLRGRRRLRRQREREALAPAA